MSLECFQIVAQETRFQLFDETADGEKIIGVISSFEYEMCEAFIQNSVRTTFPEHRQLFMKAIRVFLMSLRTSLGQKIKKYVNGDEEKGEDLQRLVDFLARVISYCQENLYVDKPFETALPLFEVLKMIQETFGDFDFHVRVTHVLPALSLLKREGLLQSRSLTMFLLSSLKATWSLIRQLAFELLCRFPDDHELLTNVEFVNDVILKSAMINCNNAKGMVAESAGLMFKLLFNKCLPHVEFVEKSNDIRDMQLQFCHHVLKIVRGRLEIF